MYDLTPQQVIEFCTECVLSDDVEKECDIPDAFFNNVADSEGEEGGDVGFIDDSSSALTP